MQDFTIYGLDNTGKLIAAETVQLPSSDEAVAFGRERLARFPRVEVWQAAVCIYRSKSRD